MIENGFSTEKHMQNKQWDRYAAAVLAGCTGVLFIAALRCGFVRYDDYSYVVTNPHLQAGWNRETLWWAFTTFDDCLWAPVMRLSHLLDVTVYGLRPAGHHLTSVLIHMVNAVLAFALLRRLTGARWAALAAAALFALHPLRVEPVLWIAARKEVLCVLFSMAALLAYGGYVKRPGIGRYLGVTALFALALMSKPMAVTLPCVLLLLDAWPYGRFQKENALRRIAEKMPWFLLAAGVCVLTLRAEHAAITPIERMPMEMRVNSALVSYAIYLWKTVWPHPLYIPYMATPQFAVWWKAALAGGLLLAMSAAALAGARRRPYLLMGWLWFLGTLAPVIGLVSFGHHIMADRFTYFPHVGLCIALTAAVGELRRRSPAARLWLPPLAVACLAAFCVLTPMQTLIWRDTGTLFSHTLAFDAGNYAAYCNYGKFLMDQGRPEEAAAYYQRAMQINPASVEAYNDLGAAYLSMNRNEEAVEIFSRVVRLRPESPEMQVNLGAALLVSGRAAEARACALRALDIAPGFPKAMLLLEQLNAGEKKL